MLSNLSQLLESKMYNPSLAYMQKYLMAMVQILVLHLLLFRYRIGDNNNKQHLVCHKCIFRSCFFMLI